MIGTVIGSYRVVGTLGKGGMGTVFVAEHTLLGRKAAIKVLLPELSARRDMVTRFFNEARAATSINDVGIVQVFDFGYHTDGSAYIVMEFLEGDTLAGRLRQVGVMTVDTAMRIARQIASSLGAAHGKRIVHRDLKPANVFIVADAQAVGGERAKVLDFGIAKLADDHPTIDGGEGVDTATGTIMGTPAYMSPEQCRGAGEVDHRSDIYSLGCVVFRMITGRLPFEAEAAGELIAAHLREPPPRPSQFARGVGAEVDALVLRLLQKSPAGRFQTMQEVIDAIAALPAVVTPSGAHAAPPPDPHATIDALASTLSTMPPPAPTTLASSAGQVVRPPRRRSRRIAVALTLAIVTAGATAYLVLRRPASPEAAAGAPPPPAPSPAIDAAAAPRSIDAGVAIPIAPADATSVAPMTPAIDAGVPPSDAPAHRPKPARRLQPDAATPPPDPLDLDGDGLPDVRR